jgi:acetyl-CoA carboxylase biotin carboxyl carrier protein
VADLQKRIDELAELMDEFGLEKAELRGADWSVGFDRAAPSQTAFANGAPPAQPKEQPKPKKKRKAVPKGTPVSSPMTGIFYAAPSPGAPPFCKLGDTVTAGQVVGLIEAMKVFNEITAPTSGTVTAVKAESGQLVQPGDPLIYIG